MTTPILQIDLRDRRTGATTRHTFNNCDGTPIRIGRDPTCEVCLADPTVSNLHAAIELDATSAHLRDLGSTNGLHVAGRRAPKHAKVRLIGRIRFDIGPFNLEISHRPNPTRLATHGTLPGGAAPDLDALHTILARLHALHAPLTTARQAFEAALADAALALAHDPAATHRLCAEFPHDLSFLHPDLSPRPSSSDLSSRPSPPGPPLGSAPSAYPFSSTAAQPFSSPPAQPFSSPAAQPYSSPPTQPSSSPAHSFGSAPVQSFSSPAQLALLAPLARTLLPDERPPASADEARCFLDRLARVLRDLAAGLAALQHLRIQQLRSFDLVAGGPDNPVLALTRGDELLAHLLAWRAPTDSSAHELMDCFAVLLAHLRGHVNAALTTACHFATHLAPPEIERQTPRGLLRTRALWRTFRERYQAYVGDLASPILKDTFKNSYRAELAELGIHLTDRTG